MTREQIKTKGKKKKKVYNEIISELKKKIIANKVKS